MAAWVVPVMSAARVKLFQVGDQQEGADGVDVGRFHGSGSSVGLGPVWQVERRNPNPG